MDATRRQKTLRALTLMLLGTGGALLASLRPVELALAPPFWVMLATMLAWTVVENLVLRQDEPKSYHGKLQTRLMQGAVMVGVFVAAFDHVHLPALLPRDLGMAVAGATVIAAGAGVRIVAIRVLDRHFSYELRVAEGHRLVQTGPYRVLRHPSYLGLVLVTVGAALALGSAWGALVGGGLMAGLSVWRIRTEEALLREAFGAEYDAYARRTWRLVPFVY